MPYSDKAIRLARVMLHSGLHVNPSRAVRAEKMAALDEAQNLIDAGHDPDDLIDAAEFGMKHVWPFSEGQAWDPHDFRKNVMKAKAEARRLRKAGNIPTKASEL